ncbi:MAG TPA: histidinol-phosphate transaminase [Acidimicrobiales bacterium]|nr:histidinol-phosphate transaminase [Acidimicrobiales bacterium]
MIDPRDCEPLFRLERRGSTPLARPSVRSLPCYRPGRSAAQARERYGVADAVTLASNELPYEPLPQVAEAIRVAIAEGNRYPDHRAGALRERLADIHRTTPDRIAVGCGTVGLLQQLALAYVDPGDEVVFADPSFEAYPIFTQLASGRARRVPLRRFTHDAAGLAHAIGERTKLVVVAEPNNPTGTAMADTDLAELADAVPETCVLVVDEAYVEFVTGRHVPDGATLLERHANAVVLRTFSKAYGLAGLRVGYAVGAPQLIVEIDKVLTPFGVNRLAQVAALASLDAHQELEERVRKVLAARGELCSLLRRAGWSVPDTQANFVFLPSGDASLALADDLERAGLVTRPFDGRGVRVTVGTSGDVERFAEAFIELATGAMSERLHAAWGLPTGVEGSAVAALLDKVDDVEMRLFRVARGRRVGPAEPVSDGAARRGDGQAWAILAELCDHWVDELEALLDADADRPTAIGRSGKDPLPIAAIAERRCRAPVQPFETAAHGLDRFRSLVAGMSRADWRRQGVASTFGVMGADRIVERLLVGPREEHVDHLETLGD